jgi:peptidoglycan hydrolase CwlO-like protein
MDKNEKIKELDEKIKELYEKIKELDEKIKATFNRKCELKCIFPFNISSIYHKIFT